MGTGYIRRQVTITELNPDHAQERCDVHPEHQAAFIVDDHGPDAADKSMVVCAAAIREALPWDLPADRDPHVSAQAKVAPLPGGVHHNINVYAGPDPGHRAFLGQMIARGDEAHEIMRRINDPERTVGEVHAGHEAHGMCEVCDRAVHRFPFGWQHVGPVAAAMGPAHSPRPVGVRCSCEV